MTEKLFTVEYVIHAGLDIAPWEMVFRNIFPSD